MKWEPKTKTNNKKNPAGQNLRDLKIIIQRQEELALRPQRFR